MSYWGFSGEGAVKRNGYTIAYKELDGNDIAPSFASNMDGLAPGSVTFFKLCFADFDGSNLAAREKEIEQVIATAKARQLKLIIGNALPVRREEGSPEMLAEYRKYNAFLEQQAASNPDVWVYDFYGVLAGSDGFLKPEYQTEDSHPNERAYAVLDQSLFPLLDKVFAGQGQSGQTTSQ
jgi:lysophospholipase L1-like esterase